MIRYDKENNAFGDLITVATDVEDNHGGPAIVMDSKGYIHLLYGPHAGPMKYLKSEYPNDITSWTNTIEFGSNLTYPSLVIDGNDNLFLVARQSKWYSKFSLVFFSKTHGGVWSEGKEILIGKFPEWSASNVTFSGGSNGYIRYSKSLVHDNNGYLHMAFKILENLPDYLISNSQYENGRGSYMIGYMWSNNQGLTWRAYNNPIDLPATVDNVELIAGNPDPQKAEFHYDIGNIAIDKRGIPHVVYSQNGKENTELYLAIKNGDDWSKVNISAKYDSETENLISPSSLSIDQGNNIYIMATSLSFANYCSCLTNWANPDNEIRLLKLSNNQLSEISIDLKYLQKPMWLPSAQNQTIPNSSPSFMFLSGGPGNNNNEKVKNEVIWVRL